MVHEPMPDGVRAEFAVMTDSERGYYIKGLREGARSITAVWAAELHLPQLINAEADVTPPLIMEILREFPDTTMVD